MEDSRQKNGTEESQDLAETHESERMKYFRRRKEKELARRSRNRRIGRAVLTAAIVAAVCFAAVRIAAHFGSARGQDAVRIGRGSAGNAAAEPESGQAAASAAVTDRASGAGEPVSAAESAEKISGAQTAASAAAGSADSTADAADIADSGSKAGMAEAGSESETDAADDLGSEAETDDATSDPREDVWNHYINMFLAVTEDGYLNIRSQPSSSGLIVGRLLKYSGGEVLEDLQNGWLHIRSGEIEGYVSSEFCVTGEEARQLALDHCYQMVQVSADRLNVRSGPGEEYPVWTQLGSSALQTWLGEENGWYEIAINDTSGYISMGYATKGCYLKSAMPWSSVSRYSETRQKIFSYGEQFLGVPYVYGGTSLTAGLDCSSFVQQVFKNAIGISLPRTSREQVNCGAAVASLSDAKAGDLLFYSDANGVIDHVAIYMGDSKILHCALSQGGVVITAYNYSTEPVAIRDVIQD